MRFLYNDINRKSDAADVDGENADDLDAPGDITEEAGTEWPEFELEGVARQREFYQVLTCDVMWFLSNGYISSCIGMICTSVHEEFTSLWVYNT